MKLYTQQLQSMSLHQFFKVWQLRNFNLTINNLQRGQVLFVHDFQQNLLLVTQDESSGSHWDHPQLTIHPTTVYYHCSRCDELVKEDIIHITIDKSHDKHGVNQFIATTIDHLKKKDVTINEIREIYRPCKFPVQKQVYFLLHDAFGCSLYSSLFRCETW